MKIKNRIKKILSETQQTHLMKKHKGEAGFEALILTPFVFSMYFFILIIFFFNLSYISYNNLANNIANQLDMRAEGYQKQVDKALALTIPVRNSGVDYNVTVNGYNGDEVTNTPDDVLAHGLYDVVFHLTVQSGSSNASQAMRYMALPGSHVQSIKAYDDYKINLNDSNKNIGTQIRVVVTWVPDSKILGSFADAIPLKADGYALIH